jgi:hypothetical protein
LQQTAFSLAAALQLEGAVPVRLTAVLEDGMAVAVMAAARRVKRVVSCILGCFEVLVVCLEILR